MSGYHEITYAFDEVSDMNNYVPKEIISGPSPNDHYCLWVYPCQEDLQGKY